MKDDPLFKIAAEMADREDSGDPRKSQPSINPLLVRGFQAAFLVGIVYVYIQMTAPETSQERVERVCREAVPQSLPEADYIIEKCVSGEMYLRTVFASDNLTPLYDEYSDGHRDYRY